MDTAGSRARSVLGFVVRWALVCVVGVGLLGGASVASAAVPSDAARSSYDDAGRLRSFVAPDAAGGARAPREAAVFEWDAVGNLLSADRYLASELSVIGITPGGGQIGAEVTIAGTGFGDVARDLDVRFAGTGATVLDAADEQLVVEVPAGARSGTVTVTRGLDTATSAEPFTVESDAAPTIARASPTVLAAGDTLTISGERFAVTTGENDVWVNEARALVQSSTATEVAVEAPPTGSGRVRVETADGSAIGPDVFVVPSAYAVSNVEDSGRLTLETGRAVTLSAAGKVAIFVIDARANDRLRALLADSTMSGKVSVWSPSGAKLSEQTFSTGTSTNAPIQLAADGTYTVLVEATSAGSVTLTPFVDVVEAISPTPAGASASVRTSFVGQHARLRFDGSAGQRIAVAVPSATLSGWIAIAPAGTTNWIGTYTGIASGWLDVRELPSDGEWDVWFEASGSSVGDVSATVYGVPADVTDDLTITSSVTRTEVRLDYAGQNARYEFDGRAGQRVLVRFSDIRLDAFDARVQTAGGSTVSSSSWTTSSTGYMEARLPSDGTYTLVVDPRAANTGSVTLETSDASDVVESITPTATGVTRTIRTTYPAQDIRLRFDARAGQRFVVGVSGSTLSGYIEIARAGTTSYLNPWTSIASGWLDLVTVPSDGSFDVWIETTGSTGGEATITVYDVPADLNESIMLSSTILRRDLRFDYPGQNARYDFDGIAGQRVNVRFPTIGLAAFTARVVNSAGSTINSSSFTSTSTHSLEALLRADDRYSIVVDPTGANTGETSVEIADAADVIEAITPTSAGVTRNVTTSFTGQDVRLRFDARAGQRYVVGLSSVSGLSGWIEIARAGTTSYLTPYSSIASGWLDLVTIPSDGSYDVWLETTQSGGGSATVTVYEVPADITDSFTLSTSLTRRDLTFDYVGQNAALSFSGTAGQRVMVRFPSIRLAAFQARVVSSGGSTVSSSSWTTSSTGFMQAVLPSNGTYSVVVDPTGANMGSVSMEVADASDVVESITPTSAGVTRTVTTTYPGQDARLRFDARAGRRYVVGLSSVSGLSGYIEIARAGTTSYLTPYSTIASGWLDLVTIPSDGSYDVWIETTGTSGGQADVTVYEVPADITDSFTLSTSLTRRDLTFDYVGQNAALSFSGTAGQRVMVRFPSIRLAAFQARVVSSGGSTVSSSSWTSSSTGFMQAVLPSNGTYSVVVDPTRDNTGSVSMEVADASDVVESITPDSTGVTRTVTTTYPGQDARLRFAGTTDQEISVSVASSTLTGWLEIARAGTTSILYPYSTFNTTGSLGPVTIPSDGSWDVWLETTGSSGGQADVTVTDVSSEGLQGLRSSEQDESAARGRTTSSLTPSPEPTATTALVDPPAEPVDEPTGGEVRRSQSERSNLAALRRAVARKRAANSARVREARATRARARATRARAAKQRRMQLRRARRARSLRAGQRANASRSPRRRIRQRRAAGRAPAGRSTRRSVGQRPASTPAAGGARAAAGLARSLQRWRSSAPAAWRPSREDRRRTWTADAPASPWTRLPALTAPAGTTALAGQVLRVDGMPLRGVAVAIEGSRARARTDRTGRFLLAGAAAGRRVLVVDGADVGDRGYGRYEIRVDLDAGETTELSHTVWLTELDRRGDQRIAAPTRRETVLTNPAIPGLEVRIPTGSRITSADGRVVRDLNLTAIPVDRPPFPLPAGTQVPTYFTAQPGGAYLSKGARIIYPNYHHLPPGHRVAFWQYDPDDRGWYVYGWGEVTRNGRQVVPDPGVRIWEFTGAMGTTSDPAPGSGPHAGGGAHAGDPVDLGTGLFVYEKTDLTLPDTIPATVKRIYRPADSNVYGLGRGTTTPYDLRLWNVTSYTVVRLILPDGGTIDFDRTSPGTSWQTGVFEQRTTPGPWFGALIRRMPNVDGWELHRRDGTVFEFGSGYGPVTAIQDRFGDRLTIDRANGTYGVATRVTTEHGRWLRFAYDGYSRATSVVDNAGRRVSYTYDADSRLETVTDADGGVTTFTYDRAHRMTAIEDARGTTFLQNTYDANGRVIEQTLGNRGTYRFAYTLDGGGTRVATAEVTDPRGMVQEVDFDAGGLPVQDTRAAGTAEEQVTRYERDATTNLVEAIVDPLGNRTELVYDTDSNVTEITRLAGTGDAVTTRLTYGADSQLLSRTDPLGKTTRYGYDSAGRLTSITDPTDRTTTIGYGRGSSDPAWISDPAGNQTDLTYVAGELRSTSDPLGRVTNRWVDSVGRVTAVTDPLGRTTRAGYSDGNLLTSVTDPRGATTRFDHDPNGNLTTVTDARGETMRATYDAMDDLITWTDGNGRTETVERDLAGNVIKVTDRKSQVTTFRYDILNRRTFAGFGTTGSPGSETYDSTIDYTYDDGDRLTELDDSQTGVVTNQFDGLNRLLSQTTPNGDVDYTYDDAGRRASISLDSSSLAAYGYDDAGRLTSVTQGGQLVRVGYDTAGRPGTLELPNGIVRTTTYDTAGQVTRLDFDLDTTPVGDVQYAYDQAGRRSATWGSLARFRLPTEIRSASYDDANRLVSLDATTLTWDLNGNLTDDGTNTYSWDSRNQLTAIRDARATTIASFAYDPLGRRDNWDIDGVQRAFIYDGWNVLKEDNTGTDATIMNGLGLDHVFSRTVGSTTRTVLADLLGSTIALTDDTGAITDEFAYGPFGESSTTATGHPYQYTGRENDGTGLYHYRNRYYSPQLKRFISEDPIGMTGSGTNYYAYVRGDPLGYTDPTGEIWTPPMVPPINPFDTAEAAAPETGYNSLNVDGFLGLGFGFSLQVSCHGVLSLGVTGGVGAGASISATHQTGSPTPGSLSIVGGGTGGFASGNASVGTGGSTGVGAGVGVGASASLGVGTTVGPKDSGC